MKNSPYINSQQSDSPKTPGGISKALLTPCRRVGLSRNWKKKGPIPFISPLSNENNEKVTPRTNKDQSTPVLIPETSRSCQDISDSTTSIVSTPKSVQLPRKSKSKKSLSKDILEESLPDPENDKLTAQTKNTCGPENHDKDKESATENLSSQAIDNSESIPTKSALTSKAIIPLKKATPAKANPDVVKPTKSKSITKKQKSPENLTKECIVVIQKKLLPKEGASLKINSDVNVLQCESKISNAKAKASSAVPSQNLFDSDSDDIPLQTMKKIDIPGNDSKKRPRPLAFNDDEDFVNKNKVSIKVKKIEHKNTSTNNSMIKKLEDKSTSITELKTNKKKATKSTNCNIASIENLNSIDDLDDFDLDCKKTILIKKTYDKVSKLSKSKSTGSITQKDIDDLKARIEIKKNLLLAKVKTKDTEELRNLIKKWRKGCQDALMELMDLMKTKFPDRQNMDYSEIMQTLRIPPHLVGYDSDNDCFESPDEARMILTKI